MGNDNVKDYPPYLDYPKPRKPQTNADKIRAMNDEELAEHFTQLWYDGPKFYCPAVGDVGEGQCAANDDCRKCFLDWLRQEDDDDEDAE